MEYDNFRPTIKRVSLPTGFKFSRQLGDPTCEKKHQYKYVMRDTSKLYN